MSVFLTVNSSCGCWWTVYIWLLWTTLTHQDRAWAADDRCLTDIGCINKYFNDVLMSPNTTWNMGSTFSCVYLYWPVRADLTSEQRDLQAPFMARLIYVKSAVMKDGRKTWTCSDSLCEPVSEWLMLSFELPCLCMSVFSPSAVFADRLLFWYLVYGHLGRLY